jgi:uncharacterized protein (UPF0335 family)
MAEKPDMPIDLLKSIDLKLSLILGKMIKLNNEDMVIKDEIKELYQSGADSKIIAQILGISTDHASQEISRYKKISEGGKTSDHKKNKRKGKEGE